MASSTSTGCGFVGQDPTGPQRGLCAAGVANGVDKQMTTLDKQFYLCSSHVGLGVPSSTRLSPLRSLPCPQHSARGPPVAGCPHRPEGPLGTALPVTSCQGGQGRGKQVLQMASCGCPAWAAVGTAQPPQSGRGGRSRRGCINHPQGTYCVPTPQATAPSYANQHSQKRASQRGKLRQTSDYTRTSCPLTRCPFHCQPLDTPAEAVALGPFQ